jgi:hypothetical protein
VDLLAEWPKEESSNTRGKSKNVRQHIVLQSFVFCYYIINSNFTMRATWSLYLMLMYCCAFQELAELEARRERVKQNIARMYMAFPTCVLMYDFTNKPHCALRMLLR